MIITHAELMAEGALLPGAGEDPDPGVNIFLEREIEELFPTGADEVTFVNVRYLHTTKGPIETIAAVGMKNGGLMVFSGHLFVLPCPHFCGKGDSNPSPSDMDTTFIEAGNMTP